MKTNQLVARMSEEADPRSRKMTLHQRALEFFLSSTHAGDKMRAIKDIEVQARNPHNYWGFLLTDIDNPDIDQAYQDFLQQVKQGRLQ